MQNDNISYGLKLKIDSSESAERKQEYMIIGLDIKSFTLIPKNSETDENIEIDLSFIIEDVEYKKVSMPYDGKDGWEKFENRAFLGFKEENIVDFIAGAIEEEYEIDTKQMPFLELKPFIDIQEIKDTPALKLLPTIEDNDANVKVSFSFNANVITEEEFKIEPPFLLVDIASKRLGDLIVGGFTDINRKFKVSSKELDGSKDVEIHIKFDLENCKIILSNTQMLQKQIEEDKKIVSATELIGENNSILSKSQLLKSKERIKESVNSITDKECAAVKQGKKGIIKLNKESKKPPHLTYDITSADSNMKIDFSFLVIDSILIGSAFKTIGSSGKTIGSSGKTIGSSGKTIGSSGKTIGSSALTFTDFPVR
jgi:hypothetical protein